LAVITVTNSNDSGTGSLRAALAATAPGDTIAFASGITSVTLAAPLVIDQTITIDGDYAKTNASVTINGEIIVQSTGNVTMDGMQVVSNDTGLAALLDAETGGTGDAGTAGANATSYGGSGSPGGDAGPGGDATEANSVSLAGTPAIENDGMLTLINSTVAGGATGGKGADGADGGDGGYGGNGGSGSGTGAGGNGGIGGDGGSGSSGTDGADAVGGILNTGSLTLEDSVVSGIATGGGGGDGGGGGAGQPGGNGGNSGIPIGIGTSPPARGNGGNGGNGGAAGNGGDGGAGGSAVGGVLNTGTVTVVGAAVLANDSATGGAGGKGGTPGDVGAGGLVGSGPNGKAGSDGNDGTTGVTGADGTATADILNNGGTESGTLTIDGRILQLNMDLSGQASTVNLSGSTPTTFTYDASSLNGTTPGTGTVDWKIVTGTGAPLAQDFTGATSGSLTFGSEAARSDETFSIQLSADAAAPRDESFTVELFDPSTGNVIGSLAALTQTVVNLEAPACFAAGTRIRTSRGDVAVEALAVGDLVVTVSGALRPIIWLGSRHVDCARHGRPSAVHPVRIRAGAFSLGLPLRDLTLSPDHAVFVEGVLIPVKHLINGYTITQMAVDSVTYFHIELESHDVVLAEGLTCETYLDTGDRSSFSTDGDVTVLHPLWGSEARDIALVIEALSYAPLRVAGPEVARIRASLALGRPLKAA
jgi:collagen type I/II/III/V/XI/XXIV/XXVII alpha